MSCIVLPDETWCCCPKYIFPKLPVLCSPKIPSLGMGHYLTIVSEGKGKVVKSIIVPRTLPLLPLHTRI